MGIRSVQTAFGGVWRSTVCSKQHCVLNLHSYKIKIVEGEEK